MSLEWKARIILDSAILAGKPTIRRMRINVEHILRALSACVPAEEILAEYPDLEAEDLRLSRLFRRPRLMRLGLLHTNIEQHIKSREL